MAARCLADFLEQLGHAGELVRVDVPLRAPGELAEITRQLAARGGPAILAAATEDYRSPMVTNLLGTTARIAMALGATSFDEVAERLAVAWAAYGQTPLEATAGTSGGSHSTAAGAVPAPERLRPRKVRGPACQQVVRLRRDVDLRQLPALPVLAGPPATPPPSANPPASLPAKPSASDAAGAANAAQAARWLTAGIAVSEDPDSRQPIVEHCELALLDAQRLAPLWPDDGELARLAFEYRSRQQSMPLAIVLGGDPAVLLTAMAPWPPHVDPWLAAGLLRQQPLDLATCRSLELSVPAESDYVLEGTIPFAEGPAGADDREELVALLPNGWRAFRRGLPSLHLSALTHRANPVCPALVHHELPNEATTIASAMARLLLPLLRRGVPELVDFDLAPSTAEHWAVVAIRKTHAWQARGTALALRGRRPWRHARWLVVVDEDVEVRDAAAVRAAVAAHCRPDCDVLLGDRPAALADGAEVSAACGMSPDGGRCGAAPSLRGWACLDATRKWAAEGVPARSGPAAAPAELQRLVRQRWLEYGLGPLPDA